jgi:hypothetical protein
MFIFLYLFVSYYKEFFYSQLINFNKQKQQQKAIVLWDFKREKEEKKKAERT